MSAHVWKAGDLARCNNDDACPVYPSASARVKGAIYRVLEVRAITSLAGNPCVGLKLDRHNPVHPITGEEGYSNAVCFRPILPAEPAFTDAMRSLKPRVDA
jgi:hypothetical protein